MKRRGLESTGGLDAWGVKIRLHEQPREGRGGHIKVAFLGGGPLLAGLRLLADPLALQLSGFFPLSNAMVQLSAILAIGSMSVAMILTLLPRWPERWLGSLDKMYRLHQRLGIGGLGLAVTH